MTALEEIDRPVYPGTPDSSMVGTSGQERRALRAGGGNATQLSGPDPGADVLTWSNIMDACPPITSTIAWVLPL